MAELEFIEEIRIARFWRQQLGEYEYVGHNADDLRRWYKAMELRGPDEIRDYLNERSGRHPTGQITGIVAIAPHPSRDIVQLWLASHTKVRTGRYWLSGLLFLVTSYLVATNLQGCIALNPLSPLQRKPPETGGHLPNSAPPPPRPNSTLPLSLPPPATNAARPTGTPH